MSCKKIACVVALLAVMASSASAVPQMKWGHVPFEGVEAFLSVRASGIGPIDVEVFITATNDLTAAVLNDPITFNTPIPGNNPITGTVTSGLYLDLANDQLFASFSTSDIDSFSWLSFLTLDHIGAGKISASGLVTEAGVSTSLLASAWVGFGLGDFDWDGDVDRNDFGVFVGQFGGPGTPGPPLDTADFDMDGRVDGDDFGVFVGVFGNGVFLLGDFDKDGDVDFNDFGVFVGGFGTLPASPPFDIADLDLDGDIDGDDFGVFVGNFGTGVPATTIPEPTAALLLLVGVTGVACTSRRK